MQNTDNTETASSNSPEENSSGMEDQSPSYLERMAGLTLAHQARAQLDLEADRCLLRRDMKARQNEQYGLGQDNLPECTEDDMGVQIGDTDNSQIDNSQVVHNHYHGCDPDQPQQPQPQPCPPRRWPWWLIAALVLPWIVLTIALIGWILNNWPEDGGSNPPVVWELDIGAENPSPAPPTIQPVPPTTQPVD